MTAPHSGDWLHVLPVAYCGMRLDYEGLGLRLRVNLMSLWSACLRPRYTYVFVQAHVQRWQVDTPSAEKSDLERS